MPVIIPAKVAVSHEVLCQCVLYLRESLGVSIHGNSWDIMPNTPTKFARVGDVVLLSYNEEHVALITKVSEPTEDKIYLTLDESNFHHCEADTRTIALSDDHIRGIYRPSLSTA